MKKNILIYMGLIIIVSIYTFFKYSINVCVISKITFLFFVPIVFLIIYEIIRSKLILFLALLYFFSTISLYLFYLGVYPLAILFLVLDIVAVYFGKKIINKKI